MLKYLNLPKNKVLVLRTKVVSLFILLFLFSTKSFAIYSPFIIESHADNEANSASKQALRERLGKINNLRASFEQTIIDGNQTILQTASGEIIVAKPQKLRWEISQPEESLLIADGKTVYNIDPFVEQVTLLDQDDLTKSNPLMLLVSDDDIHWQQVSVSQNENNYIIQALDTDAPIAKLVLNFNSGGDLLGLESTDRQEQTSILVFNSTRINQPLSSNLFTFEASDTWVIDDQRAN